MANEVEPSLWRKAVAATNRYFKTYRARGTLATAQLTVESSIYRTGWIMGYRAGRRSQASGEGKHSHGRELDRCKAAFAKAQSEVLRHVARIRALTDALSIAREYVDDDTKPLHEADLAAIDAVLANWN